MTIKPGYIRVSEILSQWDRFGNVNAEVLQAKSKLGTEVHEAITAHHHDIAFPITRGEGYFTSYQKWIEISEFSTFYESRRFYCEKLKVTGEIDAIGTFPGSENLVLIDFKTSASKDNLFWQLQGQFYHYLCLTNEIKISDRFLFVQLHKDGNAPKVHEYKCSNSLMNICMSAYICYKYLNGLDVK